jgi:hypothetical protein
LELNYTKNAAHCWACGYHGSLWKVIVDFGYRDYAELFRTPKIINFTEVYSLIKELPRETINVYKEKKALDYLLSRGLTIEFILERNIKFCYDGYYSNCIIFPSYDKVNTLNYFVAHNYHAGVYNKCKGDSNITFYESFIDKNIPISITEGIYDCAVIPNCIPMLGLQATESLLGFVAGCDVILAIDSFIAPKKRKDLIKQLESVTSSVQDFIVPAQYEDINKMYCMDKELLKNKLKPFYEIIE